MTTNRNLLEEEIQSDIADRLNMMSKIRTFSLRYTLSESDKHLFLTYSIPTIYAIWEGFIHSSFQIYIREINKLRISNRNICKRILVYHMESEFKQFKQYPEKYNKKENFFKKLETFYDSDHFLIYPTVNTQNNVGFSVLNSLLEQFNLDKIETHINNNGYRYNVKDELEFLLRIRNGVAHGNNAIIVEQRNLDNAIVVITKLMELVLSQFKKGFDNETYLNAVTP